MRMHRRRARLCLAAAAGMTVTVVNSHLVAASQSANDQTVFLGNSDATGNSSFSGGPTYNWLSSSNTYSTTPYTNPATLAAGSAPTSGYAYVVTGNATGTDGILQTPTTGNTTFAGDSLTIIPYQAQTNLYDVYPIPVNGLGFTAAMNLSGTTAGQTTTIGNLVLGNGGAIINATTASNILNGNITLLPTGTSMDGVTTTLSGGAFDLHGDSSALVVNANFSGSGMLHIYSTTTSTAQIAINSSSGSAFTGGVLLDNTPGSTLSGSVNNPILDINSPTALGSGGLTVGTLANSPVGIQGTGPSIDNTTGSAETLVNTPITLNGALTFKGTNALNLGTTGLTVATSANLTVTANILSISGTVTGGNNLTVSGPGAFEMTSPGLLSGANINAGGGVLAALNTGFSPSQIAAIPGSESFATGSFLGIDTTGAIGGTYTMSASLPSGSYGLAKLGPGTLLLSAANSYTGQTNISTGTLQIGNVAALPSSGNVSIAASTILDLNGTSISVGTLSGAGTVTNSTTTPVSLTLTTGGTTFTGNIANGSATTSLVVNLASTTGVFNMSGATNGYTGSTTLTSGTMFIGANSLKAGNAIVFNGGSLGLSAAPTNDPSLNATVTNGASYNFNVTGSSLNVSLAGPFTGASAGLNKTGLGILTLSGTGNTYGGQTTLSLGNLAITSASNLSPNTTVDVALLSSNTSSFSNFLAISNTSNYTIANTITGPGNFQKSGSFAVTLSGNNSYTGWTNISSGVLKVGSATALGSTANVAFATNTTIATLDLNGFNTSVGSMSGAGVVTNSSTTPVQLTISAGGSSAFTGNIANGSATTSLNVNLASPTASFTMSAATNGYTGNTNLGSGTLFIGANTLKAGNPITFNGGTLGFTAQPTNDPSSNFTAVNGNSLNFNVSGSTVAVTLSNPITDAMTPGGTSSVTMSGTGTLILAGANSYTGTTTIYGGTLAFPNVASLPSGIANNGIYVAGASGTTNGFFGIGNNTSNFSFALPGNGISGPGGLQKIGSDTVTLTGTNNTYTGFTSVAQGTLVLGNANALGSSNVAALGSNSAAPNGTLDLNGFSESLTLIAGAYGGVITNSNSSTATLTLLPAPSTTAFLQGGGTYFGSITGNINVVVNNPATSVVTQAIGTVAYTNTYTGSTNLASGILSVNGANSFNDTVVGFNGGTLEVSSAVDLSSHFSSAPNQQYNILVGSSSDTFSSGLNSPGGSLVLGNTNVPTVTGMLVLAAANQYSGPTIVNTGVLQAVSPLALANTSSITLNASYASPFILGSTSAFTTLQINDSSGSVGLTEGNGVPITLNLSGLGANPTAYTYAHFVSGNQVHTPVGYQFPGALQGVAGQTDVFGGNINLSGGGNPVGISGGFQNSSAGGILKLTGTISGVGPLVLGLNPNSTTILAAANSYSGETQITNGDGLPTTVQLGANSAIPAGSGLDFANSNVVAVVNSILSTTTAYQTATFDLHGFNTSTAYVTSSTSTITQYGSVYSLSINANASNGVVTNNQAGTTSKLSILGNPPSGPFLGTYQDGTGKLALDFNGAGQVFSMTGTNNYSGGTTVDAGTLVVQSLKAIGTTLTGGGNITVNANVILQQTSPSAIFTKLQSGYASGNWNGSGVNSTAATSDTTHLTAVGMLTPLSNTTFEGQSLNVGDVALKLTYYGDATLDGQVNSADYTLIDGAYLNNSNSANQALTGWQNGDFNYDGVINGSDYTLIDNAFNLQGTQIQTEIASPTGQIGGGATSAVPEPTSLALPGLGVAGLLGRRRRRH